MLSRGSVSPPPQLLSLVTQLGPTFIKLGQALSIRTDLIPEAYALELRRLQDAVPPFDSEAARNIMRRELGVRELKEVFRSLSEEPIASASIGQVYRGTLLDGREVAVKVQRPGILGEIALDLFILRLLTPAQVFLSNLARGTRTEPRDVEVALSLVDEWGRGFVAEVDYRLEARNTMDFIAAMDRRGLNAVTAPEVVQELSGPRVIVTRWMEGTRLDRDASADVPRLCSVAVNAYLTMLLDTGVLHCDPHPGNLLRTRDGRLCILDWGMTLEVPRDLQYSLLEFIAHINTEDYDALLQDFINLGFSPPDKLDQLRASGLTEGIAFTFRQLNKGGGPAKMRERVGVELRERYGDPNLTDEEVAAKAREEMLSKMQVTLKEEGIDVSDVTSIMEAMSRRNRELFKLPPYVLYLTRAFSTLEGIGLSINEDYSILQECYPYLAKRLFADTSPRAKESLRAMLFSQTSSVSPGKLLEMAQGFNSYTSSITSPEEQAGLREAEDALIDLLLSAEGNALQDILIEEASRVTDALLREGLDRSLHSAGGQLLSLAVKLPLRAARAVLPPGLSALTEPLRLPYILGKTAVNFSKKSEEDEVILNSLRSLVNIGALTVEPMPKDDSKGAMSIETISGAISKQLLDSDSFLRRSLQDPQLMKRAPLLTLLTRKFGSALFARLAERIDQSTGVSSKSDGAEYTGRRSSSDRTIADRVGVLSAKSARAVSSFIKPVPSASDYNSKDSKRS